MSTSPSVPLVMSGRDRSEDHREEVQEVRKEKALSPAHAVVRGSTGAHASMDLVGGSHGSARVDGLTTATAKGWAGVRTAPPSWRRHPLAEPARSAADAALDRLGAWPEAMKESDEQRESVTARSACVTSSSRRAVIGTRFWDSLLGLARGFLRGLYAAFRPFPGSRGQLEPQDQRVHLTVTVDAAATHLYLARDSATHQTGPDPTVPRRPRSWRCSSSRPRSASMPATSACPILLEELEAAGTAGARVALRRHPRKRR